MPFVFIIVGLVLVIAGVRGTATDQGSTQGLYTLVKDDFTGPNSFLVWVVAILVIGAVGYIKDFQSLSRAFMVLIIVTLFLSNGGFFQKLQQEFPGAFGK